MPDPLQTLNFDHVHESDSRLEHYLVDQDVPISPSGRSHGSYSLVNDNAAHPARSRDPETDFAYAANPSSDTLFISRVNATNGIKNNKNPDTYRTTPSQVSLARGLHSDSVPNLNLASFGSQPWPTTSAPYLEFAPQPVYEPTGELLNEQLQNFGHFDDPSYLRQQNWQTHSPVLETISPLQRDSTVEVPNPATDPSTTIKDAQGFVRPALKRSLASDTSLEVAQQRGSVQDSSQPQLRKIRRVAFEQMSGTGPMSADDENSSSSDAPSATNRPAVGRPTSNVRRGRGVRQGDLPRAQSSGSSASRPITSTAGRGSRNPTAHPPSILSPEKVFPIQIGSELFRLSGASISSDAPSYFTQFFEEQIKQNEESGGVRTLYIDRDPETFRDVARHLQGDFLIKLSLLDANGRQATMSDLEMAAILLSSLRMHSSTVVGYLAFPSPKDADTTAVPRLIDQLFDAEIFIQIGESHFQIPKDIFSDPGNSPNFFSLGFAVFFSTPGEVFPGLDRRGLLRPPSITPPYVPGRSAQIFAQLLHLLRGYPLHIENEDHRAELLRDCRYFHLRGLEQKLIAHDISYNLERQEDEICLRIEDIKPSGVSYKADDAENEQEIQGGWVRYARPFVDGSSYELVIEIGGETTILDLNEMRLDFHGLAKARVSSLFQVIANKMNLPTNAPLGAMMLSGAGGSSHTSPGHTPLSEDRVKVLFELASHIVLDGSQYEVDWDSSLGQCMSQGPNRLDEANDSDAMSEGDYTQERNASARSRAQTAQSGSTRSDSTRKAASARTQVGTAAPPPRIDTTASSSRKRRRPTISTSSNSSDRGQWVIRNGQWRLRVQQNAQDSIRGGYEIIFIAVKVDAFSQERARNARRGFLAGGG